MKGLCETLKLKEGGMVLLENNKVCKVQGVEFIRLKLFVDWEMLLQEVRYVQELNWNL